MSAIPQNVRPVRAFEPTDLFSWNVSPSAAHLWDYPALGQWDGGIPRDPAPHMTAEQIVILHEPTVQAGETHADATVRLAREALRRGARPAIRVSDVADNPAYYGVIRTRTLADFLE